MRGLKVVARANEMTDLIEQLDRKVADTFFDFFTFFWFIHVELHLCQEGLLLGKYIVN